MRKTFGEDTGPGPTVPDNPATQHPATNAAFTSEKGKGGGTSPLLPIAIALTAAASVIGAGWWASRRFAGGAEQGR